MDSTQFEVLGIRENEESYCLSLTATLLVVSTTNTKVGIVDLSFVEPHAKSIMIWCKKGVKDRVWGLSHPSDDNSFHRIIMVASLSWPSTLAQPATASTWSTRLIADETHIPAGSIPLGIILRYCGLRCWWVGSMEDQYQYKNMNGFVSKNHIITRCR